MKLPIQDNISFLLSAVTIVVIVLEILSIIGLDIPMPYAPFIFALFVIGITHRFAKWRKTIFKLKFSSINLLMTIAVVAAFYLGEYPEAAVVIVLYVLGERLEDIGLENSKSALDQLVNRAQNGFVKLENKNIPLTKLPSFR
jgi:Cd2+/Zn2+-exporting ATPase